MCTGTLFAHPKGNSVRPCGKGSAPWEAPESVPDIDRPDRGRQLVGQPKPERDFDDGDKMTYAQELRAQIEEQKVNRMLEEADGRGIDPWMVRASTPLHSGVGARGGSDAMVRPGSRGGQPYVSKTRPW